MEGSSSTVKQTRDAAVLALRQERNRKRQIAQERLAGTLAREQVKREQEHRLQKRKDDAAKVKLSNPFSERNGIGIGALVVAVQRSRQAETRADRELVKQAMEKRLKRESVVQAFELMDYEKQVRLARDRADQQLRAHLQLQVLEGAVEHSMQQALKYEQKETYELVTQKLDDLEAKLHRMRGDLVKPGPQSIVEAIRQREIESVRPAAAEVDDELAQLEASLDPLQYDVVALEMPGYAKRLKGPLSGRSEASLVSIGSGLSSNGSLGSSEGAQSLGSSPSRMNGNGGGETRDSGRADDGSSFAALVDKHQQRRAQVLGRLAGDIGATSHDLQAVKEKRSKKLTLVSLDEEEHYRSPFTLQRVAASRFADTCQTEVRRLERNYRKLVKQKQSSKPLPPEAPYSLKCVGSTADAVYLKWQPPVFDGGANVYDYELRYTKRFRVKVTANTSKWESEAVGPVSTTRWIDQFPVAHFGFAITGLSAMTQIIDVQARAVNVAGKSEWSESFPTARTAEAHTPGPPLHLMVTHMEPELLRFEWQAPLSSGGRSLVRAELQLHVEVPDFLAITASGNVSATRIELEKYPMPEWTTFLDVRNLRPGAVVHDVTVVGIDDARERTFPSEPIEYLELPTGTPVERLRWEIGHYSGIPDGVVDVVRHGVHQRTKRTKHIRVLRSELKRELQKLGLSTESMKSIGSSQAPIDMEGHGLGESSYNRRQRVLSQGELDERQLHALAQGDGLTVEQLRQQNIKRKQYHKKINLLVRRRQELDSKIEDMKAERMRQKNVLQLTHKRVSVLRAEIAALAGFTGKFVDSMALHGRMQRFEMKELRHKLNDESTKHEGTLADLKLDIVEGMQEQEKLEVEVQRLADKVKEREAALLRFEQDCRRAKRKAKMLARMGNVGTAKSFDQWKAFVRNRLERKLRMKSVMLRMLKRYIHHGFTKWASQTAKHRKAEEDYEQRASRAQSRQRSRGARRSITPSGSRVGASDTDDLSRSKGPVVGSKEAQKLARKLDLPVLAVLGAHSGEPGSGKVGDPLLQPLVVHREKDRIRGAGGKLLERAETHRVSLMAETGELIRATRKLDATVDISDLTGDQLLELGTKKGAEYSTAAARLIKFKSKLALMGTSQAASLKVLLGAKEEEMAGAGYGRDPGGSSDDDGPDSDDEEDGRPDTGQDTGPHDKTGGKHEKSDRRSEEEKVEKENIFEPVSGPFGSAHDIRRQQLMIKQHGVKGLISDKQLTPSKIKGREAADLVVDALAQGRRSFQVDVGAQAGVSSRSKHRGKSAVEPEVELLRGDSGLVRQADGRFVSNNARAKANQIALTVQTLVRQAERYIMDGRYGEAHPILRRIEFVAGRCKDTETLLRIYASLSKMYMGLDRCEIAAVHYHRFVELAKQTGNEWLLAEALEGRAVALQKTGALQDALRLMAEATELRALLGDSRGRIRCMRKHAKVMFSLGTASDIARGEQLEKLADEEESAQRKMVGAGINELSRLQARLIGVGLSDARLVKLEPVGPTVTFLRNEAAAIEQEAEVVERLVDTTTNFVRSTQRRLGKSATLLEKAKSSGDDMIEVPGSATDTGPQFIRREQLMEQLQEAVQAMQMDIQEADTLRKRYITRKANCADELEDVQRRMRVELTALSKKISLKNHFRCVALNTVNLRHNDALGRSSQSVPQVATTKEKAVTVFGIESGQAQAAFQGDSPGARLGPPVGHFKRITALAFYEKRVYTGSMDGTIRVWDTQRRLAASTARQRQVDKVFGTTNAPAGLRHLQELQAMNKGPSGGGPMDLEGFSKMTEAQKKGAMYRYKKKKLHREGLSSVLDDADPEFDVAETGASSTQAERDRACIMTLRGHTGSIWSIAANSLIIVSGSSDQTIRLWRTSDGKMLRRVRGHTGTVRCIGLGEQAFATGAADHEVRVWTYSGPKVSPCQVFQQNAILDGHGCIVTCVAMAGFECVSGGTDGRILVWDIPEKKMARDFQVHKGTITTLQFDATKIVSAGNDLSVRVTDLISGSQLQVISEAHAVPIQDLMYDTQQLVTVAGDHSLRVWSWHDSQGSSQARMHIVAGGQTPQDIARLYNVTVKDLIRWNKLATANEMYVGRRLMVAPSGADSDTEDDAETSLGIGTVSPAAGSRKSPDPAPEGPASQATDVGGFVAVQSPGSALAPEGPDRPSTGNSLDFSKGYKLFKPIEFKGRIGDIIGKRKTLRDLRRALSNRKWGRRSQPITSVPGFVSFQMLREMVDVEDARHTMDARGVSEMEDRQLLGKARRLSALAEDSRARLDMDMQEYGGMAGYAGGAGGDYQDDEVYYGQPGLDPEMGVTDGTAAALRHRQQQARLEHERGRKAGRAAAQDDGVAATSEREGEEYDRSNSEEIMRMPKSEADSDVLEEEETGIMGAFQSTAESSTQIRSAGSVPGLAIPAAAPSVALMPSQGQDSTPAGPDRELLAVPEAENEDDVDKGGVTRDQCSHAPQVGGPSEAPFAGSKPEVQVQQGWSMATGAHGQGAGLSDSDSD